MTWTDGMRLVTFGFVLGILFMGVVMAFTGPVIYGNGDE